MAQRKFTRKEIAERNNKNDAVFIIDNNVFDVTKFLDEHPGGHEVLLGVAGKDATEDFNDVGHSLDAKELMVKYKIGTLVDEDRVEVKKQSVTWTVKDEGEKENSFVSSWKFPVLLGILVTLLYTYLFS